MPMLFEQGYTRGRWDFIVALFTKAQVVCYNFIMKGLSIEQLPLNYISCRRKMLWQCFTEVGVTESLQSLCIDGDFHNETATTVLITDQLNYFIRRFSNNNASMAGKHE
jgi:hypothetical protein